MFNLKSENITVRTFAETDVENKIKWINNPENNVYLHYDLPLEYEKTVIWYNKVKNSATRLDAIIEYSNVPVGLIGLLNIDKKNLKAEYYVCMGESVFKGKGIAKTASLLLISYAFEQLKLNKIYLFTEEKNVAAQGLFEKIGFKKEGLLKSDLVYDGRIINRYAYGLLKEEYKK